MRGEFPLVTQSDGAGQFGAVAASLTNLAAHPVCLTFVCRDPVAHLLVQVVLLEVILPSVDGAAP